MSNPMHVFKTPTVFNALKQAYPLLSCDLDKDFVGVFDGLFSKEYCSKWVQHFENADKNGFAYDRNQGFNRPAHIGSDSSIDYWNSDLYQEHDMRIECVEFVKIFWEVCYSLYVEKFSILKTADAHKIYNIKIQRTRPGEGYHIWHAEDLERSRSTRVLTFILYLNDIEDGGETEFLYLGRRIKPVEGRLVLWPAGFTHTHRGNPPLKDTKYVITGWVEL